MRILSFLLIATLAISCQSSTEPPQDQAQHEHQDRGHHPDHPPADRAGHPDHGDHPPGHPPPYNQRVAEVELNGGELWKANPETVNGVENMIAYLTTYENEGGDFEVLKKSLLQEYDGIFRKCTMTGEAHHQLHNFLIPIRSQVDSLTEDNMADLKTSLKRFWDFFE